MAKSDPLQLGPPTENAIQLSTLASYRSLPRLNCSSIGTAASEFLRHLEYCVKASLTA